MKVYDVKTFSLETSPGLTHDPWFGGTLPPEALPPTWLYNFKRVLDPEP